MDMFPGVGTGAGDHGKMVVDDGPSISFLSNFILHLQPCDPFILYMDGCLDEIRLGWMCGS